MIKKDSEVSTIHLMEMKYDGNLIWPKTPLLTNPLSHLVYCLHPATPHCTEECDTRVSCCAAACRHCQRHSGAGGGDVNTQSSIEGKGC